MLATLSQRSSASQLQVGMGAFTNDVTSILGFLTPLPPPPSVTKCHFLRLYFDILFGSESDGMTPYVCYSVNI